MPRATNNLFFVGFTLALAVFANNLWAGNAPQPVAVSIIPQKVFVEQIGGDLVSVQVLVGEGQSPATYDPTPKQVARLSEAKIYFSIGVPFETKFLDKIKSAAPGLKIIDTRQGVKLLEMVGHEHHGEEHRHNTHEMDPHIWLDPVRVKIQAGTICEALVELMPEHRARLEANLESFLEKLDLLDKTLADKLAGAKGKSFMVFHPSFGYFADRYGLLQTPVEIEGKSPGARQIAQLVEKAKELGIKILFVQPQFSSESAKAIAKAIDGHVEVLNPLSDDYFENLERMVDTIAQTFK